MPMPSALLALFPTFPRIAVIASRPAEKMRAFAKVLSAPVARGFGGGFRESLDNSRAVREFAPMPLGFICGALFMPASVSAR
jgi:hypothetical protein